MSDQLGRIVQRRIARFRGRALTVAEWILVGQLVARAQLVDLDASHRQLGTMWKGEVKSQMYRIGEPSRERYAYRTWIGDDWTSRGQIAAGDSAMLADAAVQSMTSVLEGVIWQHSEKIRWQTELVGVVA